MSDIFKKLREKVERDVKSMSPETFSDEKFQKLCEKIGASPSRVLRSIGTLGGG